MKISIKLPAMIREDKTRLVEVVVDGSEIDLRSFLQVIGAQNWGKDIIDDGHIKSPFGLIIDNEMVMMKTNPSKIITEESKIEFIPFITGG